MSENNRFTAHIYKELSNHFLYTLLTGKIAINYFETFYFLKPDKYLVICDIVL